MPNLDITSKLDDRWIAAIKALTSDPAYQETEGYVCPPETLAKYQTEIDRLKSLPVSGPVTRWTLIAKARTATPEGARARDELCRMYWYPVYCYIRRSDHEAGDTQALLQRFFAHFLASDAFVQAGRERGRFRVVLESSLESFLAAGEKRAAAMERGSEEVVIPFPTGQAEEWYASEQTDRSSPQAAFNVGWFNTVLRIASDAVERKWGGDKQPLFKALVHCRQEGCSTQQIQQIVSEFNVTVDQVSDYLRWLEFEEIAAIHNTVAETVESDEIETEFAALLASAA